jgi:hypothetical protein
MKKCKIEPDLGANNVAQETEHWKLKSSVGDPDPQDQHIFGPPGSRSISQRYVSGSRAGSSSFPFLIKVSSGLK